MQTALRTNTTVLPGHRIEICDPALPEGAEVEVVIKMPETPETHFDSALDFLHSLPPGPRAFETWEEYEKHLQKERDAWER